jgi:hypothetical protein
MFKLWITKPGKLQQGKDMKIDAEVVRKSGGKVVCRCATVNVSPKPWWIRYELRFAEPEKGQLFRAEELLAQDGDYEVKVKIDGEMYGTYPFKIKDSKIVKEGRAKREGTPAIIFIEGGRDAWWIRRKEAGKEDLDWLVKTAKKELEVAEAGAKKEESVKADDEESSEESEGGKKLKKEIKEEAEELEDATRKTLKGIGKKLGI